MFKGELKRLSNKNLEWLRKEISEREAIFNEENEAF